MVLCNLCKVFLFVLRLEYRLTYLHCMVNSKVDIHKHNVFYLVNYG